MDNTNKKKDSIMDDEGFVGFVNFVTDQFGNIDEKFEVVEKDIKEMKNRLQNVQTTMVTKSFLTDKLIDLKVELSEKIDTSSRILKEKKVFNEQDVLRVKEARVL